MIKSHSDDPNVAEAAQAALSIINKTLEALPKAESYDYGGQQLKLDEYGVCTQCTTPIAEAQAAETALRAAAEKTEDETVREHLEIAAQLLHHEAQAAMLRAELHNGQSTEPILNRLLGFLYDRKVHDTYEHSHHGDQN